jgi:predicted GIY-YIG superfamily endonuclease
MELPMQSSGKSPSVPTQKGATQGHTALYRYLAADGQPLYIGITGDVKQRKESHAHSRWNCEATNFTVEWYDSLDAALAAEFQAIKNEKPMYNRAHNFGDISLADVNWPSLASDHRIKAILLAEWMQAEIDSGSWPVGYRIPSPRDLGSCVDVGTGTAISAVKKLVKRKYAYLRRGLGHFVRLPPGPDSSGRSVGGTPRRGASRDG